MKTNKYVFEETLAEQFGEDGAFPEILESGKVYFNIEYGLAVHLCPCGCGDKVYTGIDQKSASHPHLWILKGNSLSPSIRKTSGCLSHYFITNGIVQWA